MKSNVIKLSIDSLCDKLRFLSKFTSSRCISTSSICSSESSKSRGKIKTILEKDLNKIRNVGIMAHIDAGKTTTTERMLYYSGVISNPGEVHHGDTVTDFMPQERERGITIQSAVVNFAWNGTSINLIDTPGHVDFTFEVQRSLRVVDSAIAILDASAGVEAQTLTVWRQASEHKLPRIIFLNKMDKAKASEKLCLSGITTKLHSTPILTQMPVYSDKLKTKSNSGLIGLVDLISMNRYIYDQESKGRRFSKDSVHSNKEFMTKRCELVDQMSDLDSKLADIVIESEKIESISKEDLQDALKRITMNSHGIPVLLGSSYRHIGVQPLIDAIERYLPNPKESLWKDPVIKAYGTEQCIFAFKVMHDVHLGPLTFLRIFKGSLKSGQKLFNVNRDKSEKLLKIYLPLADDLKELDEIGEGHVVVVSGLKDTITGDTLTSSGSTANIARARLDKLRENTENPSQFLHSRPTLSGVRVPDPVFFCSIEPASNMHQKAMDEALVCLQREDPSFQVRVDPDSSQTVLSGMGELHLEVIHERMKREYKVDSDLGRIQVAYKETILEPITKRILFERKLGDVQNSVSIELELKQAEGAGADIQVRPGKGKEVQENLAHMYDKHWRFIRNGVLSSLRFGPKLSFPVIDIQVHLNFFEASKRTSDTIVEAAAAHCVRQCLLEMHTVLLEPFAYLEITVDDKYQQLVMDDLSRRRFLLKAVDHKYGNNVIIGTAPLSELMGYSTVLRSLSSGVGSFAMEFSHYSQISSQNQEHEIIKEIRGF